MKYGGKVQVVAAFLFAFRIILSLALIAVGVLCLISQRTMYNFFTDLGISITFSQTLFAGICVMVAGLVEFILALCRFILLAGIGELIENSGKCARDLKTIAKNTKPRSSRYDDDDEDDDD